MLLSMIGMVIKQYIQKMDRLIVDFLDLKKIPIMLNQVYFFNKYFQVIHYFL